MQDQLSKIMINYDNFVFSGGNCEQNTNECASNPCHNAAVCEDGINQYTCKCLLGYTGQPPWDDTVGGGGIGLKCLEGI